MASDSPSDPSSAAGPLAEYFRVAEMLLATGDVEGAARALEQAGAEIIDLESPAPKRRLAQLMALLGDHRLAAGGPPAALESFRAALSLSEAAAAGADDPDAARERAFLRYRIGTAELAMGRKDAALAQFQRGCAEVAALSAADPESARLKRDLSASRSMLGDALAELGRDEAALGEYGAALELARDVDGAENAQPAAQAYMATLHRRLGGLFEKLGRPEEAVLATQTQAGILESFRRVGAATPEMLRELIDGYQRLARLSPQEARGPLAAALEAAQSLPPPGDPGLVAELRRRMEQKGAD